MSRLAILWVLISLLSNHILAKDDDFTLEAEATIELDPGGYARVDLELGELPQNKRGIVAIKLKNNTSRAITVGGFSSSSGCKCVEASFDRETILAGETATLSVLLRTPDQPKQIGQLVSFSFGAFGSRASTTVILRYKIAKLAAFRDKMASVNLLEGDPEVRVRLPLEISSPQFHKGMVELELPECFKTMQTKFLDEEGKHFLEVRLRSENLHGQTTAGDIRLRSKETQLIDTILFTVLKTPCLQVVPHDLRIAPTTSADGKTEYRGTLLVRVRPKDSPQAPTVSDDKMKVEARLANSTVAVDVKSLATDTARVSFRISPTNEKFDPVSDVDGVFLTVNLFGETFRSKVKVRVEQSGEFSIRKLKK